MSAPTLFIIGFLVLLNYPLIVLAVFYVLDFFENGRTFANEEFKKGIAQSYGKINPKRFIEKVKEQWHK